MTNINEQTQELLETLKKSSDYLVPAIGKEATEAGAPVLYWVTYLRSIHKNRSAIELLNGTESALIEACAYCCLGLGRAAIASIRTQVDLLLSYTYFRDHPKEWKKVQESGEGYFLFSEIIKYHGNIDMDFNKRFGIVEVIIKPNLKELYKVMSAHVHAQSTLTMPTSYKMKDLVLKHDQVISILNLQQMTSSALSAFLLAIYGKNWSDLPPELYKSAHSMMSEKQAQIFFK